MRGLVLAFLAAIGIAQPSHGITVDENSVFSVRIGGSGYGYNEFPGYDPATSTLALTFARGPRGQPGYGLPIKTRKTEPYLVGYSGGYSLWAGIVDIALTETGGFPTGRLNGSIERIDSLLDGLEPGVLVFDDDGWVCTGGCELAVRNYGTGEWIPSGDFLTSGVYTVAAIPLPASGMYLGSVLVGAFGWSRGRRAFREEARRRRNLTPERSTTSPRPI